MSSALIFVAGLSIGSCLGVAVMCLVQINNTIRKEEEKENDHYS